MILQTFTVISSISVFTFLVFFCFTILVVVFVQQIKLTHVGFRAHVKIASRIVSYLFVIARYFLKDVMKQLAVFQLIQSVARVHLQ